MKKFLDWMFGPSQSFSAEQFYQNHPLSQTKPDDLIVANIIDGFARYFSDWKIPTRVGDSTYGEFNNPVLRDIQIRMPGRDTSYNYKEFELNLARKAGRFCTPIKIRGKYKEFTFRDMKYNDVPYKVEIETFKVNGVELDKDGGLKILQEYTRMHNAVKKAEAVAAKAKADQEDLEKRWNLAESVLGMERTPSGALVYKSETGDAGIGANSDSRLDDSVVVGE